MADQGNGLHIFTDGARILRVADGMPADVLAADALYATIRTGAFYGACWLTRERLEIEQGDPGWMVEVLGWPI